jgi:hypothetical protein
VDGALILGNDIDMLDTDAEAVFGVAGSKEKAERKGRGTQRCNKFRPALGIFSSADVG